MPETYVDTENLTPLSEPLEDADEMAVVNTSEAAETRDQVVTLGALKAFFWDLPTSDPGVAGEPWNDGGTVKISTGP